MDSARNNSDHFIWRGSLFKDGKLICDIQSSRLPINLPACLDVEGFNPDVYFPLSSLPKFEVYPLGANPARLLEWQKFLTFLMTYRKVAIIWSAGFELLINPPATTELIRPKQSVLVSYRCGNSKHASASQPVNPAFASSEQLRFKQRLVQREKSRQVWQPVEAEQLHSMEPDVRRERARPIQPSAQASIFMESEKKQRTIGGKMTFAQTHPSYLETLGQSHASWIFGALAELVDNARDAGSTRLDITIEQEYCKSLGTQIPVLSVTDNGTGMTHSDILRMVSFGHNRPENDDVDLIGRFGVGFKTGAMRLGKDVVVFTQSKSTRSIAFLSRSFNEGKEDVEIPIITYQKEAGWMDFDLRVHSKEEAEVRLQAIRDFSPYNEYMIGQRFTAFGDDTGTTICICNLDRWGLDNYTLQWDPPSKAGGGPKAKCDITIRSRRVRSRPGQMTKEVPLDYSLHAYLEVMFLEPKMKIYVQGTLVRTRRLHKSLNNTKVFKDTLLGKKVELTLGRSQAEKDRGNCGIFLYWHGRLIEAYKRVGGMIHSGDMGHGVIGVIDVTDVMRIGNGGVAVLNHKQGFLDCEAYAHLEDWLGNMANAYWDDNFDTLKVGVTDKNAEYKPDHSWVQCNKCLKWRILDKLIDPKDLPDDWFCYLPPFRGFCSDPEVEVKDGVVTIAATRTYNGLHYGQEDVDMSATAGASGVINREQSDGSIKSDGNANETASKVPLKRLKRGPAVTCKRQNCSKRQEKK